MEDCFVIICLVFNNKYTKKNNPLLGLLLKLFEGKKQALLIPNWGY